LGKKVGMTQVYNELGKLVPVSVIQAGPCVVMQVKSTETDGYNAIQLGFDEVKPVRRKNPEIGHAKKANAEPKKFIKEMRLADDVEKEYKAGESVTVNVFSEDKSHGTERKHRAPGSIASFASDAGHGPGPKRGKKMAGHMGNCRITTKNHDLVEIDEEKNLLIVKGSIPGPAGGYCIIRSAKK